MRERTPRTRWRPSRHGGHVVTDWTPEKSYDPTGAGPGAAQPASPDTQPAEQSKPPAPQGHHTSSLPVRGRSREPRDPVPPAGESATSGDLEAATQGYEVAIRADPASALVFESMPLTSRLFPAIGLHSRRRWRQNPPAPLTPGGGLWLPQPHASIYGVHLFEAALNTLNNDDLVVVRLTAASLQLEDHLAVESEALADDVSMLSSVTAATLRTFLLFILDGPTGRQALLEGSNGHVQAVILNRATGNEPLHVGVRISPTFARAAWEFVVQTAGARLTLKKRCAMLLQLVGEQSVQRAIDLSERPATEIDVSQAAAFVASFGAHLRESTDPGGPGR